MKRSCYTFANLGNLPPMMCSDTWAKCVPMGLDHDPCLFVIGECYPTGVEIISHVVELYYVLAPNTFDMPNQIMVGTL